MKQKDGALIIIVAAVSIVIASVGSNLLFSQTGGRQKTAETVEAISPNFSTPDQAYFNKSSIDPTQIIHIGDSTNTTPFKQNQ